MFDSPAFDVAIGLIFLYVVLALVCSTVNEAIATAIGLRARYLETGLLNLLSGAVSETPAGIATAEKFYAASAGPGSDPAKARAAPGGRCCSRATGALEPA